MATHRKPRSISNNPPGRPIRRADMDERRNDACRFLCQWQPFHTHQWRSKNNALCLRSRSLGSEVAPGVLRAEIPRKKREWRCKVHPQRHSFFTSLFQFYPFAPIAVAAFSFSSSLPINPFHGGMTTETFPVALSWHANRIGESSLPVKPS